jgi:hypothetical protein
MSKITYAYAEKVVRVSAKSVSATDLVWYRADRDSF